jgi:hypothetical protein
VKKDSTKLLPEENCYCGEPSKNWLATLSRNYLEWQASPCEKCGRNGVGVLIPRNKETIKYWLDAVSKVMQQMKRDKP